MSKKSGDYLTKREQQIMEVLYRSGSADVAAVIAGLEDAPSNPAVRTHLRILEDKGHLTHTEEGGKFVYRPTRPRHAAARSALRGLLRTFFNDSAEKAMATLLSVKSADLSPEGLERLRDMIDKARNAKAAGETDIEQTVDAERRLPMMSLITFTSHAAPLLLDVSLRSLALFAVAGIACLALRHASAASRHALWLLTFGGLLVLPVFCACLPHWAAPILPQASPGPRAGAASPRQIIQDQPDAAIGPAPGDALPTTENIPMALPTDSLPPTPVMSAADWAIVIWMGGFAAVLSHTLFALMAAWRLVRRCRAVTVGPLVNAATQARRALGVTGPVCLREGMTKEMIAVPMTFGAIRPAVLLTREAADWPPDRLQVVLLHEMAHICRRDWLTMVLARAVCALYWFHPLVWLAAHRLRAESEEACDDLVLRCGVPAPDYAAHLLEIIQGLTARRSPLPATVAMAQRREVGDRLRAILTVDKNRKTLRGRGLAVAVLTSLGAVTIVAAVHPVAADHPAMSEDSGGGSVAAGADDGLRRLGQWQGALLASRDSPWKVTLSNGVQVMLGDVSALNGAAAHKLWLPDGTLLEDYGGALPHAEGNDDAVCNIGFVLLFPSDQLKDAARVSFGKLGERPSGGTDLKGFQAGPNQVTFHGSPLVSMGFQERFRPSQTTTDLAVHVATGPETELISAPPRRGAAHRLASGEVVAMSGATVLSDAPDGARGLESLARFVFTLPARFVRDQSEYKISLVGPDGLPLHVPSGSQTYPVVSGGTARIAYSYRTAKLPLARVSAIRLTYRPSLTAVFRNVPLRPDAPTDSPAQIIHTSDTTDDRVRFLAGLTAVQGQGVVVTLSDSRKKQRMTTPFHYPVSLIHDTDINLVVNELKAAGAEAVAVNDQRLVATSAIRCAGTTVLVNNLPQPPPYVVRAIGNPTSLRAALNLPGGVADELRQWDPAMFRVKTSPRLLLPPYRGGVHERYARPVSTASTGDAKDAPAQGRARSFLVTWRVPSRGVHRYRILLDDAQGTRVAFDRPCTAGQFIQVPVNALGSRVAFRLYDNAKMVRHQTL